MEYGIFCLALEGLKLSVVYASVRLKAETSDTNPVALWVPILSSTLFPVLFGGLR